MPMWRCPHCGTPQAETARCWVCRRSSTACLTCRHYRRSVAAKMGYCGLDPHRLPLLGDEIRPCWEAGPLPSSPSITAAASPDPSAAAVPPPDRRTTATTRTPGAVRSKRTFVDVAVADQAPLVARLDGTTGGAMAAPDGAAPRWSLWED